MPFSVCIIRDINYIQHTLWGNRFRGSLCCNDNIYVKTLSLPECLEELGVLIQNNGMVVCGPSPQKTVPLIAAQISDRDNTVRTAALNTFVIIHGNVGEAVYKFTSQAQVYMYV